MRVILQDMDARVPMCRVETVAEAFARSARASRFYLVLIGGFAVLATLLAVVGLYGVFASDSTAYG